MASGATKNKTLEQNVISRKNDVQSVIIGVRWQIEIGLR